MKKEYRFRKQIIIIALSVVAVFLAAGLFWYINAQNGEKQSDVSVKMQGLKETVAVPEIRVKAIEKVAIAKTQEKEIDNTLEEPAESVEQQEEADLEGPDEAKYPVKEAPPSEPPADIAEDTPVENPDENGQCQPENTSQPEAEQPQGGDTNSDGAVYVPGFGYIENSGPSEGGNSHTDGDWDKEIGTMQ